MKSHFLILVAFFALATRSEALTDKGKVAAKQLEAAMIEESDSRKPKDDDAPDNRENIRLSLIPRLRSILANPDSNQNLQETLNQLSSYFTSEAVLKNIALLQEEIRLEREAEDNTALANIQEVLTRAGKAVREAKAPADLDTPMADLVKLRQRTDRGQASEAIRTALYQVEPTLQFITQWQNYLSAMATGNSQSAQDNHQHQQSPSSPLFGGEPSIL